jgi:hypothetical protein
MLTTKKNALMALILLMAVVLTYVVAWTRPQLCSLMLGTERQIAATPREDFRAERLAIEIGRGVVADQQVYDRLTTELSIIRTLEPAVDSVKYHPTDDGRTLLIKLNLLARALLHLGMYRQWDCLNAHYHAVSMDSASRGLFLLHLKGIYDMQRIADLYGRLSGVRFAEPNRFVTADTRNTLCVTAAHDTWHYVLYKNGVSDQLYYFVSTPVTSVKAVAHWRVPESSDAFETSKPDWVSKYWTAEACA